MASIPAKVVCSECRDREIAAFKIYCTKCRLERCDILLDIRNRTVEKFGEDDVVAIARVDKRLLYVSLNLRGSDAQAQLSSV